MSIGSIAILAPSPVPFQLGGAEKFWKGLYLALSEYSDSAVELLKIPCREESFTEIVQSYRIFSELDLKHFDLLLTTKYPAWMVQHPNHVVYLQHTLRGLYDTYHFTGLPETFNPVPAQLQDLMRCVRLPQPTRDDLQEAFALIDRALQTKNLPSALFAFPGPLIREIVHFFDRVALAPAQIATYLAISHNVAKRKDYFPTGVPIKVLHHPTDILLKPSIVRGKYFFTASRLNGTKRVHLLVEAMRYVKADIQLKIAGTGPDLPLLTRLAAGDPRISFLGYVPDKLLPQLYAEALAVPVVPYDEDYGLVTLEAMQSGKAVITTHDAGGVCELVEDSVTGLCVEPTPASLGAALECLAEQPELAEKMGRTALERTANITWSNTAGEFLAVVSSSKFATLQDGRRKILVCSTFAADAQGAGGPRRLYQLCLNLAQKFFVVLICFAHRNSESVVAPHFYEICLNWDVQTLEEADRLFQATGTSADDFAFLHTCTQNSLLRQELTRHGQDAACVVLSHPYLFPAVRQILPTKPLLYDAHNVESDLKAQIFDARGQSLIQEIFATEQNCVQASQAVLACSEQDRQRFCELYGAEPSRTFCLPNGCNLAEDSFLGYAKKKALRQRLCYAKAKLALFIGSGHRPNLEAAEKIFHFAPKLPAVQFLLVGSVSTQPCLRELPRPENVHLLGVVSEKVKNILLGAADVALNPVTSGSGTNLKSIEYLAAGLETISTPFGLRGLEREVAQAVHSCEIEDFPMILDKVLRQPASEAVLLASAKLAREHYAWDHVFAPLETIVTSVIKRTEQK